MGSVRGHCCYSPWVDNQYVFGSSSRKTTASTPSGSVTFSGTAESKTHSSAESDSAALRVVVMYRSAACFSLLAYAFTSVISWPMLCLNVPLLNEYFKHYSLQYI